MSADKGTIPLTLLLIEDNPSDARLLDISLKDWRPVPLYVLHTTETLKEAVAFLNNNEVDLVLSDLSLPDTKGLESIVEIHQQFPTLPIVVLTGLNDEAVAVEAVSSGAQDYLVKGHMDGELLWRTISYAIERNRLLIEMKKRTKESFQNVINNAANGMILIDPANSNILYMNKAAKSLVGEKISTLSEIKAPFLNAGETKMLEFLNNDEPVFVEASSAECEWGDDKVLLYSLHDITKRIKTDQLKDEFINTVSHELRTPLGIAYGAVSALNGETFGKLTPKQSELIVIAERNCTRLSRLINDLLDFSRLESGQASVRKGRCNLKNIFVEIENNFQQKAKEHGVNITYQISEDIPEIYADSEMLIQLINNLLSNALRFAKSKITIEAKQHLNDAGGVILSISDDGKGIAADDHDRLFKKFVQVDRMETPNGGYKGTGLGLSICQSIVNLHNGKIWVESELGNGAQFLTRWETYREQGEAWDDIDVVIKNVPAGKSRTIFFLQIEKSEGDAGPSLESVGNQLAEEAFLSKGAVIPSPGQEGLIVLTDVEKKDSQSVANKLLTALHTLSNAGENYNWRCGIANYPENGKNTHELINHAIHNRV